MSVIKSRGLVWETRDRGGSECTAPAQIFALAMLRPQSGDEPSSDTLNFSTSVNQNWDCEEDETFWEDAQRLQAPCGKFHRVLKSLRQKIFNEIPDRYRYTL